jgi:membrane dipeptidase
VKRSCMFIVSVLCVLSMTRVGAQSDAQALRLPKNLLIVDAHNNTVQQILLEHIDIGIRQADGGIDLPRLREGGVSVPFFALYVPDFYKGAEAVRRTLDYRDAMQTVFDKYPEQVELATSADDISRITGNRKIAIVLTVEGGHQIDDDLAVLRMYRKMGVLSMTLTHFRGNNWADSSTAPPEHNGLTEFGKDVVREMNAIGMIVDISHVSDKTFYDALTVSSKPVIASHSSCRSMTDHPRNMSDDMLVALGKNGGVVGVNFYSAFLNQQDAAEGMKRISKSNTVAPTETGAALDEYDVKAHVETGNIRPRVGYAKLDDAVACIDHIAKLIGVEHVGIGSDFDGIPIVPQGLEDISKMPALAAALMRMGYSASDVRKIMGGNFMRVIRQVVGH